VHLLKGSQASTALHKYTSFCSHQPCGEREREGGGGRAPVRASGQAVGLGESRDHSLQPQIHLVVSFLDWGLLSGTNLL